MTYHSYHKSVLTAEVVHYMEPKPYGVYVDATFGGGGHTTALLEAEPTCRVIGIDIDREAIDINGPLLQEKFPERVTLIWGSFAHLSKLLKKAHIAQIDGILADFGTSQYQIFQKAGFSFTHETPLDMRMSPGHTTTTAADIINYASAEELAHIFFTYGEEHQARKIAKAIVHARYERGHFETTKDLAELISRVIPVHGKHIHPATKVFQALRIVVNDELNAIKSLLKQVLPILKTDGRIVCISFHSLEDRLVKQFFKSHEDQLHILTPKVVTASKEELERNLSSRSAKLRAASKY